jgi:fibrinogen beta/gamma subunit family protein
VIGTAPNPALSCMSILTAARVGGTPAPSGVYWLDSANGSFQAYCDMVTDGGGWTVAFAGQNGSPNVFDHFDAMDPSMGGYANVCTDPATHCLRRVPRGLDPATAEVAVSCGGAIIKFRMPVRVHEWLSSGAQFAWEQIGNPTSIGPTPVAQSAMPHFVWTGTGTNESFVFYNDTALAWSPTFTFASSYSGSAAFNGCNGQPDTSSPVRIMYR